MTTFSMFKIGYFRILQPFISIEFSQGLIVFKESFCNKSMGKNLVLET